MKILILGGTGQVGFELQRSLMLLGEILTPTRAVLNLDDGRAVLNFLQRNQPDLIVNAAAYTAVDKAETNLSLAQRLNAELPAQLADWCSGQGKQLIHYSSDYVYPGSGNNEWQEESIPDPVNAYGLSKLAGDQSIISSGCKYLIFRTSWVYSARGNNFMKTMLKLAKDKEALSIVNDQIGAPTSARLIAEVTALAVERQLGSGLYHLATNGQTSWKNFAEEIFTQAKQSVLQLKVKDINGITSQDFPAIAKRPMNSRLSLKNLEKSLKIKLPHWQSSLVLTLQEYLA